MFTILLALLSGLAVKVITKSTRKGFLFAAAALAVAFASSLLGLVFTLASIVVTVLKIVFALFFMAMLGLGLGKLSGKLD